MAAEPGPARHSSISWRALADLMAARLYHQAYCDMHSEAKADPANCPNCADRAAYRAWEVKSGKTHREAPYTGDTLDVLAAARESFTSRRAGPGAHSPHT